MSQAHVETVQDSAADVRGDGRQAPSPPRPEVRADSRVTRGEVRRFFAASGLHLLLAALSLVLVLPFVWMILTSFKDLAEVNLPTWLPGARGWHPENYRQVFEQIPFARYYANSVFIACWVTFLQVFTSSLAAFAFARLKWPGRDKVFLIYLATMMLPGLVMMIPNFQTMIFLGLVDTMIGVILPLAFTAFGTFLLRQFMLTIPRELDEAAAIDGASSWRIYWDIILPLSRPGLITLAIFTFMFAYNNFFWPLVMLRSEHKLTLPIGLLYFENTRSSETHLLMAAVAMSVIPMIIVFVTLQKYLVKGIQLGAVKG
ncbi:MAG: carbohydrate ABC transporter permease [Phycisphaeraceae bacterium]